MLICVHLFEGGAGSALKNAESPRFYAAGSQRPAPLEMACEKYVLLCKDLEAHFLRSTAML